MSANFIRGLSVHANQPQPHHHGPRLSEVKGPTDVPLIKETIGEVFLKTVHRFPDRLALVVCDQLDPELSKEESIRSSFVPNGGQTWQTFLHNVNSKTSPHIRFTYSELNKYTDQFARGLQQLGFKKGDRLGVWLPNCYQYLVAQLAAAKLGVILVTINPGYRTSEVEYALNKVGVKALLIKPVVKTSNYVQILNDFLPELNYHNATQPLNGKRAPMLDYIITIANPPSRGMISFDDLLIPSNFPLEQELKNKGLILDVHDPINIQFTSGTTGNPKGVLLSHRNLINNGFFVGEGIHLSEIDRICLPVPLYHCFGLVMGNIASFTHGSAMVYPSATFDPVASLAAVQAESCTALYGVPTMFISQLNHPHFDKFTLTSLRTGIMAGSICPIETMKEVIELMHCKEMTIGYGMTETSPISFQTNVNDPMDIRCETVGKVHPHVSCRIVDENGHVVPVGVKGELLTKGYSVMIGYCEE